MQATLISGNEWLVTWTDGNTERSRRVGVATGGGSAEAIAAVQASQADPSQTVIDAETAAVRQEAVILECQRRIYLVADELAQIKLATIAASGSMSAGDLVTYNAGNAWIEDMLADCIPLIANPALDLTDDAQWTTLPAGVDALAAPHRSQLG